MLENLKNYKIILASGSPRRRELLSGLDLDYTVKVLPDIDESYPGSLKEEEIPLYICKEKAAAYLSTLAGDELLITADTIVWIDGRVLGKPRDEAEARKMLAQLSGRTHRVITGVCIRTLKTERCFTATTEVTFSRLSPEEIDDYVSRYRPLDKAGAYGIQEWIGFIGVEQIKGSYFNVMGLPVQRLYRELKQIT